MHRYLLILTALLLTCSPALAQTEIQPETEGLVMNADGELVPISTMPKNYGPYGVTGRVLDEAGNPVSGAFIFVKSGFQNNMQTRTDDTGRFSITQSHPEPGQVAVLHPDYAPLRFRYSMGKDHAVSDWRVLPETTEPGAVTQGGPPADIILKPVKPEKIRLLDTQGQPIPNAAVTWTAWWHFVITEHSSELLPGRTDENGEMLWACAPTGPASAIRLNISSEIRTDDQIGMKYMRFTTPALLAGEEVYEITVPRPLTISGTLTDIITGERITKFTFAAELGPDALARSKVWMPWSNIVEETTQTRFPDGRFALTLSSCEYPTRPIRVLISADGYDAYLSPEIPWDAEDIRIELELAPSRATSGTILQPDGTTPAANADVLLGNAQTQVRLKDGRVDVNRKLLAGQKSDDPRDLNPREVRFFHETGENGRFHFPKSSKMEYILVAHATGWACVRLAEHKNGGPVTLQPWGEVKGRVM